MLTDTQKNSVYQYFFTIMAKWYEYVFPVIGSVVSKIKDAIDIKKSGVDKGGDTSPELTGDPGAIGEEHGLGLLRSEADSARKQLGNWLEEKWDDATGKTQIEMQNEFNRQMAEEEYQRNLDSIGDTASAYEAAGFNRNLMYSSSPTQYNAPQLQAYSGSAKLDTMLNRIGKVLQFIPAMYNASAALEKIDQEREKTAQSQLRTTGMGLSILQNAYKLDDLSIGRPYGADIDILHARGTRNRLGVKNLLDGASNHWNGVSSQYDLDRYMDAARKYRYGLLDAIDISNQLRRTRNSYLGYQYDLDRRFGAAGRIVGMASQGLGAVGRFAFPILNNFGGKFK